MGSTVTCRTCGRNFERSGRAGGQAYCKSCTARADRELAKRPRAGCKECGKKISAPSRTVRYCSKACSAAGQRRSSNESGRRNRADPEKHAMILARQRAWAAGG